jgi:hypothetical protein
MGKQARRVLIWCGWGLLLLGAAWLASGCGCASLDSSRLITMLPRHELTAISFAGLDEAESTLINQIIDSVPQREFIAGYWHNPSCRLKPWHECDFQAYYSAADTQQPPRSPLALEGGIARYHLDYEDVASGLEQMQVEAVFTVAEMQAALDQQFPPHDINRYTYTESVARLPVSVAWTYWGSLNGKDFSASGVEDYTVGLD